MLSMWDVVQAAPFNRVLQNLRIERMSCVTVTGGYKGTVHATAHI